MEFETKLANYAELIVAHGINSQPGQMVQISTESCNVDFALLISKAAYRRGASYVQVDLSDPRFLRQRVELSDEKDLDFVPNFVAAKYDELVERVAASVKLIGPRDPDVLSGLNPARMNRQRMGLYKSLKNFYDEGISKSKVQWTVAAASTPGWAARIFPDDNVQTATRKLWDEIFKICRVDRPDFLEVWDQHNGLLQERAERLNEMKINQLHFVGPGTDLKVGLSDRARFKGGTDISPRGVAFEPNLPTEECFTTPDYRRTQGVVAATRPFLVNGTLVKGLKLTFKEGEITEFSADAGGETFGAYIASDAGAKRLGEVALVGIDSPIYQSGLVFEEILFDENAACHIAVGLAYKFCLSGIDSFTDKQLDEIGCNESSVHTDMMISSDKVDVFAETASKGRIQLINQGHWAIGGNKNN